MVSFLWSRTTSEIRLWTDLWVIILVRLRGWPSLWRWHPSLDWHPELYKWGREVDKAPIALFFLIVLSMLSSDLNSCRLDFPPRWTVPLSCEAKSFLSPFSCPYPSILSQQEKEIREFCHFLNNPETHSTSLSEIPFPCGNSEAASVACSYEFQILTCAFYSCISGMNNNWDFSRRAMETFNQKKDG